MARPSIYIVERDKTVQDSIIGALKEHNLKTIVFSSPLNFLSACIGELHGCLVVDFHLPEMSGLELQRRLFSKGCNLPFIVISKVRELKDAIVSMRQGALDFVVYPFAKESFISLVHNALDIDRRKRKAQEAHLEIQILLDKLTKREREILKLIIQGKLTKQIASQLKISAKTIDVHRYNITKKMNVESVAQLFQVMLKYQLTDRRRFEDDEYFQVGMCDFTNLETNRD